MKYESLLLVVVVLLPPLVVFYMIFFNQIHSGLMLESPFEEININDFTGDMAIPVGEVSFGSRQNTSDGKVRLTFPGHAVISDGGGLDQLAKEDIRFEWELGQNDSDMSEGHVFISGCVDPKSGNNEGIYRSPLFENHQSKYYGDLSLANSAVTTISRSSGDYSQVDTTFSMKPKTSMAWIVSDRCLNEGKVTKVDIRNIPKMTILVDGVPVKSSDREVSVRMAEAREGQTLFLLWAQDLVYGIPDDFSGEINGGMGSFDGYTSDIGKLEYIEDGKQKVFKLIDNYIKATSYNRRGGSNVAVVKSRNSISIETRKDSNMIKIRSKVSDMYLDGWPLKTGIYRWLKDHWLSALWFLAGVVVTILRDLLKK